MARHHALYALLAHSAGGLGLWRGLMEQHPPARAARLVACKAQSTVTGVGGGGGGETDTLHSREKWPLRGAQAVRNGSWRADRFQKSEARFSRRLAAFLH
jgi:hypothetical protein